VLSNADSTLLAVRLLLAAVFLLSGATKLMDLAGTHQALRDFGLPAMLARPMALLLPWLELITAGVLVPTTLAWYGAWGALALLTVFLGAIGIAMARGRRPNCHCFGQLHSAPVGWQTVLRNIVLAACAGWLTSRGRGHSGPELWTWFAGLDRHGRNVAIVFGIVAGVLFLGLLDRSRPQPESDDWSFPLDDEEEEPPAERPAPAPRRRTAPPPTDDVRPAGRHPLGIGLPVGTPAPEFELPGLSGEKHSLRSFREVGDVLLVFSSPFCESCEAVTANLVRWMREMEGLPQIVLVNIGTASQNLAKLKGFDASRVLLQPGFDVAEMYDCSATPAAVLVGADGLVRSLLAVGGLAIAELVSSCARSGAQSELH
jgi:peroxiredoxin